MRIDKLRCTVELDHKSYFWVECEGDGFRLTVTDGNKHPIHFTGITQRQLHSLIAGINKALTAHYEDAVSHGHRYRQEDAQGVIRLATAYATLDDLA